MSNVERTTDYVGDVPVVATSDVVVVGGGSAGVTAAVSAARNGCHSGDEDREDNGADCRRLTTPADGDCLEHDTAHTTRCPSPGCTGGHTFMPRKSR